MRRLAILLLALPLAGCLSDQKQHLAQCKLDAAKTYPDFLDAPSGQPLEQITLCMQAAGYEWVGFAGDRRCRMNQLMMGKVEADGTDVYCFQPSNPVGRWLYNLEEPHPKSN